MNFNTQNINTVTGKSVTKPRTYSTDNTNKLKNCDTNVAESDIEVLSNRKGAKNGE